MKRIRYWFFDRRMKRKWAKMVADCSAHPVQCPPEQEVPVVVEVNEDYPWATQILSGLIAEKFDTPEEDHHG